MVCTCKLQPAHLYILRTYAIHLCVYKWFGSTSQFQSQFDFPQISYLTIAIHQTPTHNNHEYLVAAAGRKCWMRMHRATKKNGQTYMLHGQHMQEPLLHILKNLSRLSTIPHKAIQAPAATWRLCFFAAHCNKFINLD